MAVLEKIRSKGVLLLIVIGVAMLIFIVSDFINSGSSFFQESGANVAKINGDKVKVQAYQETIEQYNDVVKMEYGNNVTDDMQEQIKQMVWEQTITEKLIDDECATLGMMVTKDELQDMLVGAHISPLIRGSRLFVDENGQFNPNIVKQIIATLDNEDAAQNYSPEDLKRLKNVWRYWEHATKANRLQEKYTGLLTKSMVVNPLEAEYSYNNSKTSADLLCTSKSYFAIPDSTIEVLNSETTDLYNKKKEQFKRERREADIAYIAFEVVPSQEDYSEAAALLSDVRKDLQSGEDIAAVVNSNSDVPYIEGSMFESQIPEELRGFAFSGSDSIYGPVLFGNTFKMAKVVERGIVAVDSVKLSVIVLKEQTEEATTAKADSIEALLAQGGDFAQLAYDNSLAQNAKKGGEIGWVTDMELDRKMSEKVFATGLGHTFRKDENGVAQIYHIDQVGKPVSKVRLAIVEHEVTASTKTHTDIYNRLKQYVVKNNSLDKFKAEASKENMPLQEARNIDINATQINNVAKVREAVRWAFENKEGQVSDVIEADKYVIAVSIEKLYDEGYRSIDEVRDVLNAEIRRGKKGDKLVAEMQGKSAAQLEAAGYHTDTIKSVNFASNFAGALGNEPQLVAHINFVETGRTSEPIKGTNSAYIFTVLDKHDTERPYDEKEETVMLSAREAYSMNYFCIEALKRAAKIEDFRYKYY